MGNFLGWKVWKVWRSSRSRSDHTHLTILSFHSFPKSFPLNITSCESRKREKLNLISEQNKREPNFGEIFLCPDSCKSTSGVSTSEHGSTASGNSNWDFGGCDHKEEDEHLTSLGTLSLGQEELEREEYSGPFDGQAVALVDSTSSPYDRHALRYKVSDH